MSSVLRNVIDCEKRFAERGRFIVANAKRVAKENDSVFVKRLKEIVGENATQKEIAGKVGVERATVGYWLSGKITPNSTTLQMIAKAYNVSVNWLIGNTDIKSADPNITTVSRFTGLSEKAVLKLAELHGRHIDCIDLLLTNPNFDMLPIALDNYLTAKLTLDKSIKEFANILQKNNIEKEDDIIKQAAKLTYQALTEPNASILKIAEYSSKVTDNKDKMQYTEYMVQQTMVKILSEFNKEGE